MREHREQRFDAAVRTVRDVLVIEDPGSGNTGSVTIVECEGTNIITTDTEDRALAVLRSIAVDAVFNLRQCGTRTDADRFRACVSRRYPGVRVTDWWNVAAGDRMPFVDRRLLRSALRTDGPLTKHPPGVATTI